MKSFRPFLAAFSCLLALAFAGVARAELVLPKTLKAEDRRPMLEVLGGGSQLKLAGDPYPLGGYLGIDIGISRETIGVSGLKNLGGGVATEQGDIGLWSVTLGKGLYYDVDMFLQFVPYGQQERVSSFGGGARWLFHELEAYPVFFSLQAVANSTSFQNLVNLSNQTADLIVTFVKRDFSLYAGGGMLRSTGMFLGGAGGVTASGETEIESLSGGHAVAGLAYRWDTFYIAAQADRAFDTNTTLKAGCRF